MTNEEPIEEPIAMPAELEMKSGDAGSPAIAADITDQSKAPKIPEELSILPVRGFVVFPGTIVPLNVRRPASIELLDDTLPRTKVIGLVTQRDEAKEDPEPNDFYHVGTAALVLKMIRQADDHVLIIAQGLRRFKLRKIVGTSPFVRAEIDLLEWLSKEDFSQYGECHGKALDALIAKGLAQHHPGTGRNNSFIAKGDDIMFDKVSLTDAGWQLFKSRKARK